MQSRNQRGRGIREQGWVDNQIELKKKQTYGRVSSTKRKETMHELPTTMLECCNFFGVGAGPKPSGKGTCRIKATHGNSEHQPSSRLLNIPLQCIHRLNAAPPVRCDPRDLRRVWISNIAAPQKLGRGRASHLRLADTTLSQRHCSSARQTRAPSASTRRDIDDPASTPSKRIRLPSHAVL